MTIDELRKKIDAVDDEVLELLEQRARLAQAIGEEKRRQPGAPGFYDPEREQRILKRLAGRSQGPFPKSAIGLVFREIISACRSLEKSLKVAYLGPAGTYSQIAAGQAFGNSVEYVEAPTIESVFVAVSQGEADHGVVPLQNSYEGGVTQTLDALLRPEFEGLQLRGELTLEIDHCLVTRCAAMSEITRIYSHPAALAQCRSWLAANLPQAGRITCSSTAAAAQSAAREPGTAAIASRRAAELLGLGVLREKIQDQLGNATRFVILSQADGPVTGSDRTSLVASFADPGGLAQALQILAEGHVKVTRVESRAKSEKLWDYAFFLDLEGHRSEPRVAAALASLEERVERLRILGSYPKGN